MTSGRVSLASHREIFMPVLGSWKMMEFFVPCNLDGKYEVMLE